MEAAPRPQSRLTALLLKVPKPIRLGMGFVLGMLWDVTTLRRIDDLGDNVGLLGSMMVLAVVVIFTMRIDSGRSVSKRWGIILMVAVGLAVVYQTGAIVLSVVDLGDIPWAKHACSDGCWLPSLGVDGVLGQLESGLTIVGCLGLGMVGGAMCADTGFLDRHKVGLGVFRQFMWGNILSAYVIFYYKAADIGPALLYVGLLAILLAINEWLPERVRKGSAELIMYQFCAFSFLLYFLPVAGAYMPTDSAEWMPIRTLLLRPGTWTPFALAAMGSLAAVVLVTVLSYLGKPTLSPSDTSAGAPVDTVFRAVRTKGRVWVALLVGLVALRAMEAIPPAPLALMRQKLIAKKVGPRKLRCNGPSLEHIKEDLGVYERFQFPADRRTWLVHKAKIFSPRHMVVPVSVEWEYYQAPGWSGRWWDPGAYWHTVKGGRQVQVPGWDENGLMLRSCKRVFTGGSGRKLRKLWRITFSTPGDQSGLELLDLLATDVPMTGTSAEDLYEAVTQEVGDTLPLGRSVREILGVPLSEAAPKQLTDLMTTDSYKIGRTYFVIDEGAYPSR